VREGSTLAPSRRPLPLRLLPKCAKTVVVTDGLVLLAAWVMFLALLAGLAFVVLRKSGREPR
jgi:hypothetical protein